jgi:AraC-like DNA-binding protein
MLDVDSPTRAGGVYAPGGCRRQDLFVSAPLSVSTVECSPDGGGWLRAQTSAAPAIVLVRTGRFARRVRGRVSVIDATQCYVQHAGEEELIQHLGHLGHRCTVVTLRPEALPALFRVRSRLAPTEFRTCAAIDFAHRLLVAECRRGGDATVIARMGREFVAHLFEVWAATPQPPHRLGTPAVTRRIVDMARDLVTSTVDPPSLSTIAAAASVSPQHLTRVFRQSTGLTLSQYRNRVRVRLALEKLADDEHDLRRIAHDLGFADHAHFSRRVMAEVGLQPRAVRWLLSARPAEARGGGDRVMPRRSAADAARTDHGVA